MRWAVPSRVCFISDKDNERATYLVAGLTSVLKYETRVGVEGVDMGTIARAYGVDIFQINDNVLTNGEVGYFGNEVGFVSDIFFSAFPCWLLAGRGGGGGCSRFLEAACIHWLMASFLHLQSQQRWVEDFACFQSL